MFSKQLFFKDAAIAEEVQRLLNKYLYYYNDSNEKWELSKPEHSQYAIKGDAIEIFATPHRDNCLFAKTNLINACSYSAQKAGLSKAEAHQFTEKMRANFDIVSTMRQVKGLKKDEPTSPQVWFELKINNVEVVKEVLTAAFVAPKVTRLLDGVLNHETDEFEKDLFGSVLPRL